MIVSWFSLSFSVALHICIVDKVTSLSSGAPSLACRSMQPRHGSREQKKNPPYAIQVHPEKIFSNESVTVTIMANSEDEPFRGFLLMGKSTPYWQKSGQPPVGTFQITEGMNRLNCHNGINNAVTHDYAQYMMVSTTEWRPPKNYKGEVTFVATIVKTYKEFWTGIFSPSVRIV